MISIQLAVVLLVLLTILLYWGLVFVILYHLTRFGIGTQPKRFAAVFLLGSVLIFGVFITSFANIDVTSIKLPW
jgi:hypothetical protein